MHFFTAERMHSDAIFKLELQLRMMNHEKQHYFFFIKQKPILSFIMLTFFCFPYLLISSSHSDSESVSLASRRLAVEVATENKTSSKISEKLLSTHRHDASQCQCRSWRRCSCWCSSQTPRLRAFLKNKDIKNCQVN